MRPVRVLLVHREPEQAGGAEVRRLFEEAAEYGVVCTLCCWPMSAGASASELFAGQECDVVVACLDEPAESQAAGLLAALPGLGRAAPVVAILPETSPRCVWKLISLGIDDVLMLPLRLGELLAGLWRLRPPQHAEESAVQELKERLGLRQLIGESPAWIELIRQIPRIARCGATVLIAGETGTGKEVCARALHYLSSRSDGPFVPVNSGAIPSDLAENELFGHEAGAFTGAQRASAGLIAQADGGTLFLDEVDSLPRAVQVKLLRFLQEREYRPLGSRQTHAVDVRVIAASNSDLEAAVAAGRFRADLFYRLNVVPFNLLPLRERSGDIPVLAKHFLRKYAEAFDRPVLELTAAAVRKLLFYDWPGNIRQLENVIERAVVLSDASSCLRAEDLRLPNERNSAPLESFRSLKGRAVERFEREYLERILQSCDGNISQAARAAHKNRRAFWELMRKHHISAPARVPSWNP